MKPKYLAICLLCALSVVALSVSAFALETKPSLETPVCTTNAHCGAMKVCFQNRCMTKTERHTNKTNANNMIIPGAVLTAVGGVGLIIGGVLWI